MITAILLIITVIDNYGGAVSFAKKTYNPDDIHVVNESAADFQYG